MPITEIAAAVTTTKAAISFVKGAKSAIKKAEIAGLLSDVYDKLIAAQGETLSFAV